MSETFKLQTCWSGNQFQLFLSTYSARYFLFTDLKTSIFKTARHAAAATCANMYKPDFPLEKNPLGEAEAAVSVGSCWGSGQVVEGLSWVRGAFLNVPDFNFRVNSELFLKPLGGVYFFGWKKTCKWNKFFGNSDAFQKCHSSFPEWFLGKGSGSIERNGSLEGKPGRVAFLKQLIETQVSRQGYIVYR